MTVLIYPCVISFLLVGVYIIGYYRKVHRDKKFSEWKENIKKNNLGTELLGTVIYHGGYPPMAKPSRVEVGVHKDYLLLYNYSGWSARVPASTWKNIESFTTFKKNDYILGGITALGPFYNLIFKNQRKNFITIEYIDVDNDENCIVLQPLTDEIRKNIYNALKKCTVNKKYKNEILSIAS